MSKYSKYKLLQTTFKKNFCKCRVYMKHYKTKKKKIIEKNSRKVKNNG